MNKKGNLSILTTQSTIKIIITLGSVNTGLTKWIQRLTLAAGVKC